jgi:5'-nucleotidase (lipoprotein e(P4) family)
MRIFYLLLALTVASCAARHQQTSSVKNQTSSSLYIDGKVYGSYFQQHAAEYKALCYQAFNVARLRIDAYQPVSNLPLCIVTDIDETILDNSPYQTNRNLAGLDYDLETWKQWTAKAQADTVPGSGSFLNFVAQKKIEVFYITNRTEAERKGTLINLQKLGLPFADSAHLLLKSTTSGKEPRRKTVTENHEIILLLGDNLADFTMLFDKKSLSERDAQVKSLASLFGNKFIVLPNSVYGDWEHALFQYKYDLPAKQKDSLLRASLKTQY